MEKESQAIIVVDLSYGDTGKGTITDFLTRKLGAHTVVRYNGGAQAGHSVLTVDGRHHPFSQFGSGTFVDGVRTHLSRFMLVEPMAMLKEERHLQSLGVTDAFERTTIDGEAVITTPFHQAVNRLKEIARNRDRHGSCGMGIGETMSDYLNFKDRVLYAKDLLDPTTAARKLSFLKDVQLEKIQEIKSDLPNIASSANELKVLEDQNMILWLTEVYSHFVNQTKIVGSDYLVRILRRPGTVIFEGAQGVLLDEKYGFFPHVTWTNSTSANAETLLAENDYRDQKIKLGIVRTYATRHGAGPFVTEDASLTDKLPDSDNFNGPWQGRFRVGYFDLLTTRYALGVTGGVDQLAVTHLDLMKQIPDWRAANLYSCDVKTDLLKKFFSLEETKINGILIPDPVTIERQAELTQLLERCSPRLEQAAAYGDLQSYLYYLQQNLRVPITVLSCGRSSVEKSLLKIGDIDKGENYAGVD